MEVILLEKTRNLGDLGEKVNVKPGYGRNFLIPQGKAIPATKANLVEFEQRRAELEKAANEVLSEANGRLERLPELSIIITCKAGDEGKLFGSVGPRDIAQAITDAGLEVKKSEVLMPLGPIHHTGEHEIDIQFHTDVKGSVKVTVVPE